MFRIRQSYREDVDQILAVSWKLMLPLSLALVILTAIVIVVRGPVV